MGAVCPGLKVVSEGQVTGYFFFDFSPGKKNAGCLDG